MAVLAPVAAFAAPVKLAIQFKPHQVFKYALKTTAEQRPGLGESLQGASAATTFSGTVRLSVKEVDAEGQASMTGQFQKLDIAMKMGDQVLDAGELPFMADLKSQLTKQLLTFKVSKVGEVKDVQLPVVEPGKELESSPFFGDAGQQVKRTMESFFQHSYSWLPAGEVHIGHTWSQTLQSALVTDPPIGLKLVHTFEGIEKVKGQECAKITTTVDIPSMDVMEGQFTLVGSGTSTTYFALKKGYTVSSKSVLKAKFSMKDMPSGLESEVTTTIDAQ